MCLIDGLNQRLGFLWWAFNRPLSLMGSNSAALVHVFYLEYPQKKSENASARESVIYVFLTTTIDVTFFFEETGKETIDVTLGACQFRLSNWLMSPITFYKLTESISCFISWWNKVHVFFYTPTRPLYKYLQHHR